MRPIISQSQACGLAISIYDLQVLLADRIARGRCTIEDVQKRLSPGACIGPQRLPLPVVPPAT